MYDGMFTHSELQAEEDAGFVRINVHLEDDELWIANYTEKAVFERRWNKVTLNCRGLIFNAFGDIIARPFPKFFNYDEPECPPIDLDAPVVVSDKMDGSLGILYRFDGKGRIATRGSFISDQAIRATEILNRKYPDYIPPGGITLLFEIIYPENRIVCDYGDMEDLVLLGSVDNSGGDSWDACDLDWGWPGPKAETFPFRTMREALASAPREGKEGYVVHFLHTDVRVKIKQEDYIAMHRIVTGLNARSVWQAMMDGTVDELIEKIPNEFHEFISHVEQDITLMVTLRYANVLGAYEQILSGSENISRKDFATQAVKSPYRAELFLMYDGKDVAGHILEKHKPEHDYMPERLKQDV